MTQSSTRPGPTDAGRASWGHVGLFYAIALAVAAPSNAGLAAQWLREHDPASPLAAWAWLPACLGPALGALVARRLDRRTPRLTTFLGTHPAKHAVAGLLPVLAFAAAGGARGALVALVAVAYASLEELGWRGYLADALDACRPLARYAITALLWWPWHLRFTTSFDLLVFPPIVLAASVLLGHAARESRSVFVAAGMHAMVIVLTAAGTPSRASLIAGGATVAGWMLLNALWRQR